MEMLGCVCGTCISSPFNTNVFSPLLESLLSTLSTHQSSPIPPGEQVVFVLPKQVHEHRKQHKNHKQIMIYRLWFIALVIRFRDLGFLLCCHLCNGTSFMLSCIFLFLCLCVFLNPILFFICQKFINGFIDDWARMRHPTPYKIMVK